jgi:hypothetical protein
MVLLSEWVFYITHQIPLNKYYPADVIGISSLIQLGIWLIPLMFMKDDGVKKR